MHKLTQKLNSIIKTKKTRLCISLDVTTKAELIKLADQLGPYVCMVKTHIDIIEDFDWDLIEQLKALAKKHSFLIFEDRKFADIGNTVSLQYEKGIYRIAEWADIINAHILPGPGIIEGLKKIGLPKGRGLLLLAEMSSKDNFLTTEYTKACVELAEEHKDFVMGFICQSKVSSNPALLHLTPGVQLAVKSDGLGQQYRTPEQALTVDGCDIIIVGRGIITAKDPINSAQSYMKACFT